MPKTKSSQETERLTLKKTLKYVFTLWLTDLISLSANGMMVRGSNPRGAKHRVLKGN